MIARCQKCLRTQAQRFFLLASCPRTKPMSFAKDSLVTPYYYLLEFSKNSWSEKQGFGMIFALGILYRTSFPRRRPSAPARDSSMCAMSTRWPLSALPRQWPGPRRRGSLGKISSTPALTSTYPLYAGRALLSAARRQRSYPPLNANWASQDQGRPYPATNGLWRKSTIINNVKTLATIPAIIKHCADWYAGIGTEGNTGTVVFSLVGKVANTGLVEVPLGLTLHDMIKSIGGGGLKGKAVPSWAPAAWS